jgi:hypothetical protein
MASGTPAAWAADAELLGHMRSSSLREERGGILCSFFPRFPSMDALKAIERPSKGAGFVGGQQEVFLGDVSGRSRMPSLQLLELGLWLRRPLLPHWTSQKGKHRAPSHS